MTFPAILPPVPSPAPLLCSLRDVERRHIEVVLRAVRGNQRNAARILGISRWSLARRLRKHGLQARPLRVAPAEGARHGSP
jgi:DNA-binding NtrC family response regulator